MGNRKHASELYNAAVKAVADKTQASYLTHAYHMFSAACVADPTWGLASYQAGNNNSDLGRIPAAVALWRRALECENAPLDLARIYINMGWRLHSMGRTKEALDATLKGIDLDPKIPLGWVNLSLIYGMLDDDEKSVEAAQKAFALDPKNVDTEIALAFALLFAGRYAQGLKHFEKRFQWRLHHYQHYPYPKWLGEEGKTVFLVGDQGLGDTLSYSRFVERASQRAQYLHLCVQPELLRLFQYSFVHLGNVNIIPFGAPYPQADAWTTFVSLPFALGLTDDEVINQPHISYPQQQRPNTWKVPDRKLHIGISWAGSPVGDIDKWRSMPVEQFLELYQVPGIQLYSLQVGAHAKDAQETGCEALIIDLSTYISDVCDTLALFRDLDMVICCESALGHIAGLGNMECWIPYSWQGRDYRLGSSGKNPLWYPKHRVFRQGPEAQWQPVFEKINEALREKLA